ncbi:MAG: alpha/beta fold hydrolase [Candidatus Azotimanducaceae bacterium WSBS_2022_MAG_OTU7]
MHYRDEGNASGYPLVLVHGSNASLHTWEPWVSLLGDDYRIISLDLPGHGLTGGVPDGDYSSAAQVNTGSKRSWTN